MSTEQASTAGGGSPAARPGEPSIGEREVGELRARLEQLAQELATVREILLLIHDDDAGARRRLQRLRAHPRYEDAFTAVDPLVSVVIPTWTSVQTLVERAIPSALAQTHRNVEVIVVGDASPPEVAAAIEQLGDPRVSFHNLTVRGPYDEDPHRAWLVSGTPGLNFGAARARGLWIAPLGDDDAFVPEHLERLLGLARARRLEFAYGRIRYTFPDGRSGVIGEFPPRVEQVGLQGAIYHAGLRFFELELGHALFGRPNDWGLVDRMMRTGVRIGMSEEVSVDYWPSMRGLVRGESANAAAPPGSPPATDGGARRAELERRIEEERRRVERLSGEAAELSRRLEEVRRSRSWRLTAPLRRLRGGLREASSR